MENLLCCGICANYKSTSMFEIRHNGVNDSGMIARSPYPIKGKCAITEEEKYALSPCDAPNELGEHAFVNSDNLRGAVFSAVGFGIILINSIRTITNK